MGKMKKFVGLLAVLALMLGAGTAFAQVACPDYPKVVPLTYGAGQGAGSGIVIGTVTVTSDLQNIYVKYEITTAG
jgi:hypothetical protein